MTKNFTHLKTFLIAVFIISIEPALVYAQQTTQTITGTVIDDFGRPIQDASVTIPEANLSAKTNDLGKFSLSKAPFQGDIIFSAVGYKTLERSLDKKIKNYNIILESITQNLDEVIVIGYGSIARKDATGAVGSVNIEDLQKAPVRSFDEALAGRVSGVQVSSEDGQPGSSINIVVRGVSSISQETAPLYVIDGFPMESSDFNTNQIDPNIIESIDVLKDAAATAIYGARGSNGVILITTKKGKVGAPTISFNVWNGLQNNIKKMEMLNPSEWAQLQLDNMVATPPNTDYNNPDYRIYNKQYSWFENNTREVNMQDLLFKTAHVQNYSVNLRGGNNQTKYSLSGNYFDQNGTIINSGFKRYQGRITLEQQLNKKLKVGGDVTYTNNLRTGISTSEGQGTGSLMFSILGYRPYVSSAEGAYEALLSEPIEEQEDESNPVNTNITFNPYLNQKHLVRTTENNILNANAFFEYNITPKLKFKSTGSVNKNFTQLIIFNDSLTVWGSTRTTAGAAGPNGSVANQTSTIFSNENYLTYNTKFNKKHSLNIVVGNSIQNLTMNMYSLANRGLSNPQLGIGAINQSNSPGLATIGANNDKWTMASFYGRASYNFVSKYYLSASLRNDGSSKFNQQNYWAWFPAVSARWRISAEPFWENLKNAVSEASLRLSYGSAGNNRIRSFSTTTNISTAIGGGSGNGILGGMQGYTFGNNAGNESGQTLGAYISTLGNPDLKWETSSTINAGLDMNFLNEKIILNVDVYQKTTTDLLYNSPVPSSTGFNLMLRNIGSIRNQGLEITINTTNAKTKNFSWKTNFNISFNANKVTSLVNGLNQMGSMINWNTYYNTLPAYILKVDNPLGTLYGLKWVGNYQYSDFTQNASGQYVLRDDVTSNQTSRNTTVNSAPRPGDIKYEDINGDGVITSDDYVPLARALPIHTGGFGNNLNFKNFDLNIFFQWSYGAHVQNANRLMFEANSYAGINQFSSILNRWTPDNQNNVMFRAGTGYPSGPNYYSSRTIEDASYLRLKTVQVGYNLTQKTLKYLKIKQLRLYMSAQNLFTLTKYTGFDPEVSTYYSALTPHFDYSSYPRARTITLGANLTF